MSVKSYNNTYFDDFNEQDINGKTPDKKNYLRILFKPGYAVQVRELNQLQTSLQAQIDKFGRSIFKEGPVLDGSTSYNNELQYVDVQIKADEEDLIPYLDNIKGNILGIKSDQNTGVRAEIYDYQLVSSTASVISSEQNGGNGATGTKRYRFFVRYTSGGVDLNQSPQITTSTDVFPLTSKIHLQSGTTPKKTVVVLINALNTRADGSGTQLVQQGGEFGTIVETGYAAGITIDKGIFFARGSFVFNDEIKTIYLTKPSKAFAPTGTAVFRIDENIVTFASDTTLVDNASGAPNENAPGADRYTISLTPIFLTSQTELTNITSNSSVTAAPTSGTSNINYIKLLEVNTGQYQTPGKPQYSTLDNTLAQRTFEESGDYVTRPFKVIPREYLNDAAGNNGRFTAAEIISTEASVSNTDQANTYGEARYILQIDPSVAYVQGYRIPLDETIQITANKARDIRADQSAFTSVKIGNYIEGSAVTDIPDFEDTTVTYKFCNADDTDGIGGTNMPTSTAITCKIRAIEKVGTKFRLYIFDLSGEIPRGATRVVGADFANNATGFVFTLSDVDTSEPTPIFDTGLNVNAIVLPQSNISAVSKAGSFPNFDSEVAIRKIFTSTPSNSATTTTLTAASGQRFFSDSANAYIMTKTDGTDLAVSNATLGGTNNNQVTLTHSAADGNLCTFVAPVKAGLTNSQSTGLTARSKTLKNQDDTGNPSTTSAASTAVTLAADNATVATNTSYALTHRDIQKIQSAEDHAGNSIPITDLELDNGQRTGSYKVGNIKYVGSGLTDGLKVKYTYFEHDSTGSYFDVSSYSGIAYKDIPTFQGVYLSDVIDFRTADDDVSQVQLDPNSPVKLKISYYLPRNDLLVVDKLGSFKLIEGESNEDPRAPTTPDNSMVLYSIGNAPFTRSIKEVTMDYIDNRRFTMSDIGNLEKRIKNLEYYTSLSLLEREANDKSILDSTTATERFKNGIITDNFHRQNVGQTTDPGFKISYNLQNGFIKSPYTYRQKRLVFSGKDATDTTITRADGGGDLLTLPFTEEVLIKQDQASVTLSVNPYDMATWNGTLELSPSSDEWKEIDRVPEVTLDVNNGLEGMVNALNGADAFALVDEEVTTNWTGVEKTDYKAHGRIGLDHKGNGLQRPGAAADLVASLAEGRTWAPQSSAGANVRTFTQTSTGTETITGFKQRAEIVDIQETVGDLTVGVSFIPFIRSRRVFFKAELLKPHTRMYAFFNGVDVSAYCTKITSGFVKYKDAVSETDANGNLLSKGLEAAAAFSAFGATRAELMTDSNGDLIGYFIIPENDTLAFNTGTLKFTLTDSSTNNLAETTTSCSQNYTANGIIETKQNTLLSSKDINMVPSNELSTITRNITKVEKKIQYYDPLAQSFLIGNIPTGCFASSLDLYFNAVSSNVPVSAHLVTVENGIPTQQIVPGTKVVKKPSDAVVFRTSGNATPNNTAAGDIATSGIAYDNNQSYSGLLNVYGKANLGTNFKFESPVYLAPGVEYAIVVMSNSPDYMLYMAEVGGDDKTTGTRISKNTYAGVSFKSQNASTWTPDQNRDFKFTINRAKFTSLSQTYRLDPQFSTGVSESALSFGKVNLISQEIKLPETSISYNLSIGSTNFTNFPANESYYFDTKQEITGAGTGSGQGHVDITLTSTSDFVSPGIDLDRTSMVTELNTINGEGTVQPTNAASDTELSKDHGTALARYITKEVVLNNASSQINTYILANRPSASSNIRMYVRTKSNDERIEDIAFERITPAVDIPINSSGDMSEIEFVHAPGKEFTSFQIKFVLCSDLDINSPKIKDFRAIATI